MKVLNDEYYSQVKASFTNYINIVIRNASINFKKKTQTLKFIESEYNELIEKDISLSSSSDISFFNSFEEDYAYQQLENYFSNLSIYNAVKTLSIQQKQILYYKFIKDYSYKQISLMLNTSEANIRNIKSRTIQKIKSIINTTEEGNLYER